MNVQIYQLRRSRPASRDTFFAGSKESIQRKELETLAVAGLIWFEMAVDIFAGIAVREDRCFVGGNLVLERIACKERRSVAGYFAFVGLVLKPSKT